jgi:chemotaxis family two-component system response regulator Rcp1
MEPGITAYHRILLVEDDAADARLFIETCKDIPGRFEFHRAPTGAAALSFLREGPGHEPAGRPDLIVLDLNLPRKDGRQVLTELRGDPGLAEIPVVILTASRADADVLHAFELRANGHLRKPPSPEELRSMFHRFPGRPTEAAPGDGTGPGSSPTGTSSAPAGEPA